MRIWIAHRHYYPFIGGVENSIAAIAGALVSCGHEVTIVTMENEPEVKREECAKVEYLNLARKGYFRFYTLFRRDLARRLRAYLKGVPAAQKPDMVIARNEIMACELKRAYPDTPLIYIPGQCLKVTYAIRKKDEGAFFKRANDALTRRLMVREQANAVAAATRCVVDCQSMKAQMANAYAENPDHVRVAPSRGCELAYDASPKAGFQNRFLFVGRMVEDKNLDMFMRAVSLMKNRDTYFVMVGDGPDRKMAEARADEYGLRARVTFEGAQRGLKRYFEGAGYLALPSKYESFGIVAVEALTVGVPVIGFPTIPGKTSTALSELVMDGETGFLCREFTAEALAGVMDRAAKVDDEAYERMHEAAGRYAKANFSYEAFVKACIGAAGLSAEEARA